MNPLRGFPGHPSHPPLTDATIGAYTFAALAAILSKAGVAEHGFAQAWWLALVVAAISSALTVLTGLLDWLTDLPRHAALADRDDPRGRDGDGDRLLRARDRLRARRLLGSSGRHGGLILTLVGFAILTAGGTIGGSITYVHGMRVLNLVDEPARQGHGAGQRAGEKGGVARLREPEVGLEPTHSALQERCSTS